MTPAYFWYCSLIVVGGRWRVPSLAATPLPRGRKRERERGTSTTGCRAEKARRTTTTWTMMAGSTRSAAPQSLYAHYTRRTLKICCFESLSHAEGSQHGHHDDTIRIRNLLLLAHVADGAQWPSPTSAPVRQPVRVSVSIPYDLRAAAENDDISKSINYGSLSKRVLASVNEDPSGSGSGSGSGSDSTCRTFRSLAHLSDHIFGTCFHAFPEIQQMALDVVKPRALPYADGIRVLSSRARGGSRLAPDRLAIQRLSCNVIVGLNQCEREDEQLVCFDVDISTTPDSEPENAFFDFRLLAREIRQVSIYYHCLLVIGTRVLRRKS